jgi:hypothetical protein
MPAGPWVLVVGCHRSGTSAVSGALVAMGLHGVDPGDRMDDPASNPEHWESLSAALLDERLLVGQGAAWDAPPPEDAPPLLPDEATAAEAAAVMAGAYPVPGPVVWKDPRVCLLLPFWRALLPGPVAAVFVWRQPLAVARSLQTRDGMALADGLALWERYNRSAALGLQGVDTYVLGYESLMADPAGELRRISGWLDGTGHVTPPSGSWDVDGAAALIDGTLRHQSSDRGADPSTLPSTHLAVADWLADHAGSHLPLAATPPPSSSPWPEALLGARRELARFRGTVDGLVRERGQLRSELDQAVAERDAERVRLDGARQEIEGERMRADGERMTSAALLETLEHLRESTSWKATAPLRAVQAALHRSRPD